MGVRRGLRKGLMLETLGLNGGRAWALTRLHGQAGSLIQAHLGHAVRRLHVGQKLVVLGGGAAGVT